MSIPFDKTLDEIRAEMFARVEDKQEEYAAKGYLPIKLNLNKGIVRGLLELWCFCLFQLYSFLKIVLKQAYPSTATGPWLVLHCRQVGVYPLKKTKTEGFVVFLRDTGSGNTTIPAKTIVKTQKDSEGKVYRFIVTEKTVIPDGELEVKAFVVAEEYGAKSNVSPGQINEISSYVPGVSGVTNKADWIVKEGIDDESEESLRDRYFLAWASASGSNKYAYMSWAKSVQGVTEVKILDQHPFGPGTIGVVIRSASGIPSAGLISSVEQVIEENRPINDDSRVIAPGAVQVAITGNLVLSYGDPEAVISAAEAIISAYFSAGTDSVEPVAIGENINLARLTSLIMGIPEVQNVTFLAPSADVDVAENELAVLSSVSFTASWGE